MEILRREEFDKWLGLQQLKKNGRENYLLRDEEEYIW